MDRSGPGRRENAADHIAAIWYRNLIKLERITFLSRLITPCTPPTSSSYFLLPMRSVREMLISSCGEIAPLPGLGIKSGFKGRCPLDEDLEDPTDLPCGGGVLAPLAFPVGSSPNLVRSSSRLSLSWEPS